MASGCTEGTVGLKLKVGFPFEVDKFGRAVVIFEKDENPEPGVETDDGVEVAVVEENNEGFPSAAGLKENGWLC